MFQFLLTELVRVTERLYLVDVTPNRPQPVTILPAEFVGTAEVIGGNLNVGGVLVPISGWIDGTVPSGRSMSIYVRRYSHTLEVCEILTARHDGLAQEELDEQNAEAERYPLGPKEYWRSQSVGKYRYGLDQHLMTDEEFEQDWADD